MERAYGYIRVSTTGQAEEGFSLDHQKSAIKDYCHNKGIKLLHVFVDEGRSGRTVNRPDFQEMLKKVKSKSPDCIVIYKIDRFARNIADFARIKKELKESGVNILSVTEGNLTNGSGLVANIFASVAEWESEVNGRRTRDALMQKFKDGWQPTGPPLGYQSVGNEGERKTCEPDPYTAPVVQKLFELYSTGTYSIADLQEWLKDKNIISKNGAVISHSRIHNILTNPFYYGLIRWNGQSRVGKHKPLISKQLFETCQYVLAKHRKFLTRTRKYNFLLSGFVRCSCGTRLVAEWHIVRSNKRKIAYYHCQKRYSPGCQEPYVEISNLEGQVEDKIKKLEFAEEFTKAVVQQARNFLNSGRKNIETVKQGLINQKTGFETKRNRLEDLLIGEAIDQDTYKRKHHEIQNKIDNIQSQIEETEQGSQLDVSLIEKVLDLTRDIHKSYRNAPDALKRHYLRFFYERFVVSDRKIAEVVPTPIFQALQSKEVVRLRTNQLRGLDSNQ